MKGIFTPLCNMYLLFGHQWNLFDSSDIGYFAVRYSKVTQRSNPSSISYQLHTGKTTLIVTWTYFCVHLIGVSVAAGTVDLWLLWVTCADTTCPISKKTTNKRFSPISAAAKKAKKTKSFSIKPTVSFAFECGESSCRVNSSLLKSTFCNKNAHNLERSSMHQSNSWFLGYE